MSNNSENIIFKGRSNKFKILTLSNEQSKTQGFFISFTKWKRKAANPHI